MKDFYFEIKKALKNKRIQGLIKQFNADPNLIYKISPKIITISTSALLELEEISKKSLGNFKYQNKEEKGTFVAIEIAFSGVFNPIKYRFCAFIEGNTGDQNMCSWTEGNLLELSFKKARKLNMKISLGHTHPVIIPNSGQKRTYGAICSKVYWTKEQLEAFGDELALKQLETGIYKRFGGDYGEMWTLFQKEKLISNFALIISPALNQLGVFEVNENGVIVYHPWEIK